MSRLLLLPVLLTALFFAAATAVAQTSQPAPETLTAEEAQALAELLRDDATRQALIDKLNTLAESGAAAAGKQPAPEPPPERLSFPRQIAEFTQAAAESVSTFLARLLRDLEGLSAFGDGRAIDYEALGIAALELGAVILATIVVFTILNRISQRIYGRLGRVASRAGLLGSLLALIGSSLLDALMIVAAWGIGYAVALTLLGDAGQMDIRQTLYLNAFLIIELIKVVLRGVLSPRHPELRIHPMSDLSAAYWYHWASRIVSVLGYGTLLVVPIVNSNISYAAGRSLQVLIGLTGLVMAILVILQNRRAVGERLRHRATSRADIMSQAAGFVGRFWHVAAIAYVFAFFVIWVSRPGGALQYMLVATGKTLVAVLLGFLVVTAISRAIAGGLRVPEDMHQRLPLLEARLNAFVPNVLRAVRVAAFLFVFGAILDVWNVVDLSGWLASPAGTVFATAILSAAAILVVAWLIWLAMSSWVEYRLNPNVGTQPGPRERTLLQLLRNAVTIVLVAVAVMLALSELGVDIGPLLAGAGVLGLAIGFGAQKLVQDVITGVFIQFENAINEGDVITVGGTTGVVERLTIRSVGIRDLSGVYHIVPFSAVDTVSNYMRDFAYHIAAIGVAYREDIGEVKAAMQDAFDELRAGEHGGEILGELEMHGVTEFAGSAVTVRARIKTRPGSQWAVGRAYNEIIKRIFDERGIEIPFPHRTLYWGEDKAGKAPPMRIEQAAGGPHGVEGEAAPASSPVREHAGNPVPPRDE